MKTLLLGALVLGSSCIWAASAPEISPNSTLNAADYSRAFAPGAMVSIFGSNLASSSESPSGLPLPTSLGGTMVELIDGDAITSLPLFFASAGQINAQLPYNLKDSTVQLRVRTSAGVSATDSLTVSERAPRLFRVIEDGAGRAIVQDKAGSLITKSNPLISGGKYSVYLNSLGITSPAATAGIAAASGADLQKIMEPVSVTINGKAASVNFAGLAPGLVGLYQINFEAPFDHVTGDVPIEIAVGAAVSKSETAAARVVSPNDVTVPVSPNGFYFVLTGGKIPPGQNKTSLSGLFSPVAFRHQDVQSWGGEGYRRWTTNLQLTQAITDTAGLALTLRNGPGSIVFDNNGIETNTQGTYYDNSFGKTTRIPDSAKAGLYTAYSMSNYLPAAFAGYFKLNAPTTFTQIIGYFDPNGTPELRFDPSLYTYRMNIFSNDPSGQRDKPKETGSFTGDVFSSDRTGGTFDYSDTGVKRVFSDGATDPIFRMVYTLTSPVTLPAGEYWFEHDAVVASSFSLDTSKAGAAPQATTSNVTIARPKALFSAAH